MKRVLLSIVSIMLVLCCVSCSGNNDSTSDSGNSLVAVYEKYNYTPNFTAYGYSYGAYEQLQNSLDPDDKDHFTRYNSVTRALDAVDLHFVNAQFVDNITCSKKDLGSIGLLLDGDHTLFFTSVFGASHQIVTCLIDINNEQEAKNIYDSLSNGAGSEWLVFDSNRKLNLEQYSDLMSETENNDYRHSDSALIQRKGTILPVSDAYFFSDDGDIALDESIEPIECNYFYYVGINGNQIFICSAAYMSSENADGQITEFIQECFNAAGYSYVIN
ncbi:hypothetical protein SAMN02910456_02272 [Ruminococcaceae bacterium YRB3002]|nr:hypothetical protein SAMN02910456_02272 [Ruminococcaceae bacterium YRB3002]